jgi:radical SAM superfamily enzyme YgiQ (UPF0313 family)
VFYEDLNVRYYDYFQRNRDFSSTFLWEQDTSFEEFWLSRKEVLALIQKAPLIAELLDDISRQRPDIIAFSVQYSSLFATEYLIERIKQLIPEIFIVVGGPSCFKNAAGYKMAAEVIRLCDAVCPTEGEKYIERIVALKSLGLANHRISKKMEGFSAKIKELDELAYADFSGMDLSKYKEILIPLSTSRGCINSCAFCSEVRDWLPYRTKSSRRIVGEIQAQLNLYPAYKSFWFNDSLLNGNLKNLEEFCRLLVEAKDLHIDWAGSALVRPEMTPELFLLMKQSGCSFLQLGLENFSDKLLQAMNKRYTGENSISFINKAVAEGIHIGCNIIVGFPGETEEDIQLNIETISRLREKIDSLHVNTLSIMPGSYLYDHAPEFEVDITNRDMINSWEMNWQTKSADNTPRIRAERKRRIWDAYCA